MTFTNISTESLVSLIREWSIARSKYGTNKSGDALSIVAEFREWIEPKMDEIEILSLMDLQQE